MKDYYRTLGVLDDAEDIIIRAAYKALAQRYHPDKWKGDLQEANKRMTDINEAYDVLSDITKRKKYDEEYFRYRARDESTDEDDSDANFISEDDEAWRIAIDFFPNMQDYYLSLSKISLVLANTYKAKLINSQDFINSSKIKNELESDYMTRYYGDDVEVKKFVKELLFLGYKKAASRINKIIRVMGSSITSRQLKEKIFLEFPAIGVMINEAQRVKISELILQLEKGTMLKINEIKDLFNHIHKEKIEITITDNSYEYRFKFTE
jgi:curved DNA-binding protein CbpA